MNASRPRKNHTIARRQSVGVAQGRGVALARGVLVPESGAPERGQLTTRGFVAWLLSPKPIQLTARGRTSKPVVLFWFGTLTGT